jgi:mannose-1-phosphate guanylyltransferase/phosphomannomutase
MAAARLPRKAMILAAGEGSRLRPLTDHLPKCMAPVQGRPLLEYTLERLRHYGVTDLVINLCHLADSIPRHFDDGSRWGVRITYSREDCPLGTAGGVKRAAWFFGEPFFVWYGDNLSNCRLERLWQLHHARGALATIALHHRENPTHSGIVATAEDERITRFLEKPQPLQVFSHWVSAGIFVLQPEVLDAIPAGRPADFGKDVFPSLLAAHQPIYGYRMSEQEKLIWIDTPSDLERAQLAWADESRT